MVGSGGRVTGGSCLIDVLNIILLIFIYRNVFTSMQVLKEKRGSTLKKSKIQRRPSGSDTDDENANGGKVAETVVVEEGNEENAADKESGARKSLFAQDHSQTLRNGVENLIFLEFISFYNLYLNRQRQALSELLVISDGRTYGSNLLRLLRV